MNRKLGNLIKAAIFALPFALPGVALAQSADTNANSNANNPPVQDDANKGSLDQDKTIGNSNQQGSSGMNSGGTLDNTDKQNAGSLGTNPSDTEPNPPAGKLDNSGSSTSSDRSVGGDINTPSDNSNMNSDTTTTTTHKKIKKSVKKTSPSDLNNDTTNDNSNDLNR